MTDNPSRQFAVRTNTVDGVKCPFYKATGNLPNPEEKDEVDATLTYDNLAVEKEFVDSREVAVLDEEDAKHLWELTIEKTTGGAKQVAKKVARELGWLNGT